MALVSSYQYWMKYDWTSGLQERAGPERGGVGNQLCPLKPVKAELSSGSGDEARAGAAGAAYMRVRV